MARYTEAVCRLCRREGQKLFLKAERCYTKKCAFERRSYAPGQHGQSRRKLSEYGMQLREKQKARRIYGVLERQFRQYFERAARRKGVTGEALLQILETRLDNVVYRMGFVSSRTQGRQLVRHGHFEVNGRRVNIPSFRVRAGDEVRVSAPSKKSDLFKVLAAAAEGTTPPAWIEVDAANMQGRIKRLPEREEIDVPVQEHLVVELYSR